MRRLPSYKYLPGPIFWWLWLFICIKWHKNHAGYSWETTNGAFESKNYTHEKAGAGHIFRVPMQSMSSYLNPHISGESSRMKTTKRPYFILTSRRFISGLIFFPFIFTSNFHDDVMMTPPQQASSWTWRKIFKIFWGR
jgi:hypothetical protein